MILNWKKAGLNWPQRKYFFYDVGGEALAQFCPEKLWMPLTGSIQGHVGYDFEKPDLVNDVSAMAGIALDDL